MKVEVSNQTTINAIFKKSERVMLVKKLPYFLTTLLYYLI